MSTPSLRGRRPEAPVSKPIADRRRECTDALTSGSAIVLKIEEDSVGYLVLAGEKATSKAMAFMIANTDGFVCAAASGEILDRLALPPMVNVNESADGADYAVSVDLAHGTTTGISAHDRASTIRSLADPRTGPEDLIRPGHVLPVRAFHGPGGTVHDIAVRLVTSVGLQPVAAVAAILNVNGEVASDTDLESFALCHGLPFLRLSRHLPAEWSKHETVRETESTIEVAEGAFRAYRYGTAGGLLSGIALTRVRH